LKDRNYYEILDRYSFRAAFVVCLLAAGYWGVVASDRYVSEAHILVPRSEASSASSMDISTMMASGGSMAKADQMLLRDRLLSVDMLNRLESALGLRAHFSDRKRDILSRMWSEDLSLEWFHYHYLSRISVEYDDYAGVLVIRAEAYDPKMAHAITSLLVEEGELYAELLDMKARRDALLKYLAPQAPAIAEVEMQIAAVQKRLSQKSARPVTHGNLATRRLNVFQAPTVPEYPLEPRRVYNIVIFTLIALVLAGVVRLLAAVIRDHKD
jgi:capsule polysaccharide export protein KpsE/RkpR